MIKLRYVDLGLNAKRLNLSSIPMETFLLEGHPFVALCDLIKHQGWADCGGAAKALVAEGLVEVDGQVETRKRCKIVAEQVVNFNGMKVVVKEGVSPEIL